MFRQIHLVFHFFLQKSLVESTAWIDAQILKDSFTAAEIVSDILDVAPKEMLWVTYGTTTPIYPPGIELAPEQTQNQPDWVQWAGKVDALYTLVMIGDDDENGNYHSIPHWIRTNIHGNGGGGDALVEYFGPTQGAGYHRYVILVHEQLVGRLNLTTDDARLFATNFFWKDFIQIQKLSTAPIAGNYFYA